MKSVKNTYLTVIFNKEKISLYSIPDRDFPQQRQIILKVRKGKYCHLLKLKIRHITLEIVDEAGKEGPYHEGSSALCWASGLYSLGKELPSISKQKCNNHILGSLI